MLEVTSERLNEYQNVKFSVLDASKLDMFEDNSFDKGYCIAVFIHMDKEDFVLYLRNVFRALKPGGLFYFDHWNLADGIGWRRFMLEVNTASRMDLSGRKDVGRNQFCTPKEIEMYGNALGFEIVAIITGTPWIKAVFRKPDGNTDYTKNAHQPLRNPSEPD